jgi:EAL domain-containing protein (putative c-di-GMP-specific phosphodiesterase class I)
MTQTLAAAIPAALPGALPRALHGKTRRIMADALAQALESGGIHAVYQPKICLRSFALIGVEALARWNCPNFGPVPPAIFIPLAEQFGLIGSLTGQIMHEALATCARLRRCTPELTMAVNVSPLLLRDDALPRLIDRALAAAGLPPDSLVVEITESHAIEDEASARATLAALRQRGIGCAIDDFGTGHASLLSLLRLPFNELKIDRAFVSRMHTREAGAIVRATLSLAREMRLHVVAEGIETKDAETLLRDLGCATGQGFRYGHPVSAESLLANQVRLASSPVTPACKAAKAKPRNRTPEARTIASSCRP